MKLPSTSSPAVSVGAARRTLAIAIAIVTLAAFAVTIAALAMGGRADPPKLRAAAILLEGSWRFHTGDNPAWAAAGTDDSHWQTIDLTPVPGSHDGDVGLPDYVSGWMAHGHAGYTGYAWYRRTVKLPPSRAGWVILGPTAVEDGYELYWNGRLLGGSGRLGPSPRLVGTRPLRFALPPNAAGGQGVLALRVFMLPRPKPGADGGGVRTPPILAPTPVGDGLHRAHWARTIAGYIVDAIEPLAMALLIGLALWLRPRSCRGEFLVLASIALALTAIRRLDNAIVSWTDLMDLHSYSWMAKYMGPPTVAAWLLAWNRWCPRPWRAIDASAIVLAIAGIAGTVMQSSIVTSVSRLGSIALFALIGARIVRTGEMRVLSLLVLTLIAVSFFGGELLDPLGVPGIWFPFGIGVSRTQYLYAVAIPLLAILVIRTLVTQERVGHAQQDGALKSAARRVSSGKGASVEA